jgi:hypothetical protein
MFDGSGGCPPGHDGLPPGFNEPGGNDPPKPPAAWNDGGFCAAGFFCLGSPVKGSRPLSYIIDDKLVCSYRISRV